MANISRTWRVFHDLPVDELERLSTVFRRSKELIEFRD
jgi:hypothetical protein